MSIVKAYVITTYTHIPFATIYEQLSTMKVTKGICHMLEVFQNKCLRCTIILCTSFRHQTTCNAEFPGANWDAANGVRGTEKKTEFGWACEQNNATDVHPKRCHELDHSRKYDGTIEKDMQEICGARNQGFQAGFGQISKPAADTEVQRGMGGMVTSLLDQLPS